jgi:outer membrane lipoprotein-sorting protein
VALRRPSRGSLALWGALALGLGWVSMLAGCASLSPPPRPISAEAEAARVLLERRWAEFSDLRTLAEIEVRRGDRTERLAGVLLLRAPSSLRFEALSPFGTPVLVVVGDPKTLTIWEVVDERAYILPASPAANRRWLGLSMSEDELVALLSGRVVPRKDARVVELLAPDEAGPSLSLEGTDGTQRIWFDPATGQAKEVRLTGGTDPARVVFLGGAAEAPPEGVTMSTLDGKLAIVVRYRNPRLNTGFDPDLLKLTIPERVRIQDFR